MLTVTLYTRNDCRPCEQAKADLESIQEKYPHRLVEIDIDTNPVLYKKYLAEIPVVEVGPYALKTPFDKQKLMMTLGAAGDRRGQLDKLGRPDHYDRVRRGSEISRADRMLAWFSKHYLAVINFFILLYFGLPDEDTYPTLEGLRNILEVQASWDPKAAKAKAEDFVDLRFVDQLRSSRFIDKLYGRK